MNFWGWNSQNDFLNGTELRAYLLPPVHNPTGISPPATQQPEAPKSAILIREKYWLEDHTDEANIIQITENSEADRSDHVSKRLEKRPKGRRPQYDWIYIYDIWVRFSEMAKNYGISTTQEAFCQRYGLNVQSFRRAIRELGLRKKK